MTKRVDYIGLADVRVITSAQFTAAGLSSPTLEWKKSNNFELDVPDDIALFLTAADPGFVIQDGPTFGDSVLGENIALTSALGYSKPMGAKVSIAPVISNSIAETSILNAPLSMPVIPEDGYFRVSAFGVCGNNSGGPATLTLRLKNLTDALTIMSIPIVAQSDTGTGRVWWLEVDGEGNTFFALGKHCVGRLSLGPGNVQAMQQQMGSSLISDNTDPQNWDITAQWSVAHANITLNVYGAHVEYALAA